MRAAHLNAFLIVGVTLISVRGQADTPPTHPGGLVAVLPLDVTNAKIEKADRVSLEESIRTIAGDALTSAGYTVLTGDNTLAVLADNNIDPSKACESSCALQAARELKATYFISGTVVTSENEHLAFIRLFDVRTSSQLSSLRIRGRRVRDLLDTFDRESEEFFAPLGGTRVTVTVEAVPADDDKDQPASPRDGDGTGRCSKAASKINNRAMQMEESPEREALFAQACAQSCGASCTSLGWGYLKGLGGLKTDMTKAVAYNEKGCNFGNGPGCDNLAVIRFATTEDPSKALTLYQKACNLGVTASCSALSLISEWQQTHSSRGSLLTKLICLNNSDCSSSGE